MMLDDYLLLITVIICISILVNQIRKKDNIDLNSIYGLFVTSINEYAKYFEIYQLGKFTRVRSNELSKDDYTKLVDIYVKGFFETYGDSETTNLIIKYKYGTKESLIKALIHQFDILLYDKEILLNKQKINTDNTDINYYV